MYTSLGVSIRRNTVWLLGGDAFARVLRFGTGIVLARLLAPEDFGLLVTVQLFTGALGFVATGGMGEALVQARHAANDDLQTVFTVQLLVCLCIYAAFFHFAPHIAHWFGEPRYTDLLRVSALTFLLRPFSAVARACLRRSMRFRDITQAQLLSMLGGTVLTLGMAWQALGVWALVLGGLIGGAVNTCLLCRSAGWRPAIRFSATAARRLGAFGLRVTAIEIVAYLRGQTPNFILSRLLGPQWVGLYNKAVSQSELPIQVVSTAAYQTVFRALASVQENLDRSRYIYLRTVALVAVYTLPLYAGLLWTAKPFIVFVYGAQWAPAAQPLAILAITGLFRILQNPSGAVLAAQNRVATELRIEIESWVLLTAGALIGVHWGLQGVALGTVPALLYGSLRMARTAIHQLGGNCTELVRALIPALGLNIVLMAVLTATNAVLPEGLAQRSPGLYVSAMCVIGGAGYALLFLYAPIPALAAESQRWRRKLLLGVGHVLIAGSKVGAH